jgi:hypothetical protein
MEERPYEQNEERRLDDEPPESLPVRVQKRDAIRLHDRPDDAGEHRHRADARHEPAANRVLSRYFEFADEFCVHDVLLSAEVRMKPADAVPAG